jgi:hypothetical protein
MGATMKSVWTMASAMAVLLASGCSDDFGPPELTLENSLVDPVIHVETPPVVVGRCNGTHTIYELGTGSFISGTENAFVALPEVDGPDVESLARISVRVSFSVVEIDDEIECDDAVVDNGRGFAAAIALVYPDPDSGSRYCISSTGAFREGLCTWSGPVEDWDDRIEALRPTSP